MKRILILLLILSSLSLASAARSGSLYPYCPEGVPGSYTQKFEINPNTLPSFEGELYFTGNVLMGSYCPEGQISYVPAYPKSIDYDISYYIGDDATFGISDARQNKPSETIHSCTVSLKQACIQYQNPLGVEPVYVLRCSDNEVKVDPVLAKAADYIRAGIKVKFNCAGEDSDGGESAFEFPWVDPKDDYDSANPLMPISLNYDPVKVNPNLAAAPEKRCNDEICSPEIGENCENCYFDCVCVDRGTCDPVNSHADSIGCVPFVLEDCDNGLDDDFDGLIDCYDSQCFLARNCKEICDDGQDNDDDGDIDCDDILCTDDEACYYKVTGTVKTATGHPLKNARVYLADSFANTIILETQSDDAGNFEIDYSHLAKGWGMPTANLPAKLGVELIDKTGQVQVLFDYNKVGNSYIAETTEFGLPTKKHFDMTMKRTNTLWSVSSMITNKGYDTHWDASQVYYDALRLFDFVKNTLKYPYASGGNTLPIKIYIYSTETEGAFYSPALRGGGVFIGPDSSRHQNSQCPENCVWHELFHFTMYNKYGKWSDYGSPGGNHEGFKNNNTGDSYEEGFAEFWPLILSKELDGSTNAVYGGYANLENNYNPWMTWGLNEEFAVASLLWDLVDSNQDKGDATAFSYKDLWNVLMSKRLVSMKEVYDAIQAKWPSKSAEINGVFTAHGFFKDTNKGNGKYDVGEPFWDLDPDGKGPLKPNWKWDANEDYVDIGTPNDGFVKPHQIFTEGSDRIGTASNYERTSRESPRPFIPDSFVKVDGAPDDALYKVSYVFTDSSLNYDSYGIFDNETGYVYIEIPPEDYDMTAIVTIDNYEGSGSISVTSADYFIPNTAGQGFMKEDTISVGAKKTNYCNNDKTCQDDESSSCGDCSVTTPTGASGNAPSTTTPTTPGTTPSTTGTTPQSKLDIDPMLIAGAVGGLIFLILLILIIKRVRRPKQPPAQPQQPVYYQQQPQQGNVIIVR